MGHNHVSTHWIALFCNRSEIVYFDSFVVEHVPEEIKEFIENKKIKSKIFEYKQICFLLMIFIKMTIWFWVILRIIEIDKTNLSDQTKFRLDKIKEIRNYFNSEINQRILCSKKLSKEVSTFNYIDKILIVLNAATGRICIISHTTVADAPLGIASTGFTIVFASTGIIKRLLKTTQSKKKKHDKILMLAKNKFNNIESLVSQSFIDMEISHEVFIPILNEKDEYEKMKENVRNFSEKWEEKQENRRSNSVNSRKTSL